MTLTEERIELDDAPEERETGNPIRPVARRGRRWTVVALIAVVAASAWISGIGRQPVLNTQGWEQFGEFFAAAGSPRTDATFLQLTWDATVVTLAYALVGTALALCGGLVLGVIISDAWAHDSQRSRLGRLTRRVVRAGLVPIRSVHEAIFALLLVRILGVDPLVAVLAIAIPFGAVTARVFSQLLDDVPVADAELLRRSGAGRSAAFVYSTLPAASRGLVSYGFYRFECGLRSATVLGVIGAAGLGYELRLSFQSLRYDEIWTLLAALVVVCGLADLLGARVRRGTRGRPGRRIRPAIGLLAALVVIGVPWAWSYLEIDPSTLWAGRARDAGARLVGELWPPRAAGGLGHLVEVAIETLAMSVLALALAATIGIAVAFVAARGGRRVRSSVAFLVRAWLLVCRAIPPPIWAFILLFVLLPGVVPGAVALAVYTLGVLGRLMAETVENVAPDGAEQLRVSGTNPLQAFFYDRLPRVAPTFAALGLYRWEVATRETVVVGVVAAGGLGYEINQQLAAFDYHALAGSLIALAVITALAEWVSGRVRRAWS